jgi:hypothetical protein
VSMNVEEIEEAIGPREAWAHQCHATSLALVKSGLLPAGARVARGGCRGVRSQHSWVVLGDPYDSEVEVVDVTLWSYDASVDTVYQGAASLRPHVPHGSGSIWEYGRPPEPEGEVIPLAVDPGRAGSDFLRLALPEGLDQEGWRVLAHAPVGGWPAGEVFTAMNATPKLAALIPIDVLGMATDVNPKGLYF